MPQYPHTDEDEQRAVIAPLIAFGGAFLLSLILTYKARCWALSLGLVDMPDGARRVHDRPTPRAGGLAICGTLATVLGVGWAVSRLYAEPTDADLVPKLLLGGTAMSALGLWDDARQLSPRAKLIGQVVIAACAFAAGIRIDSVSLISGEPLPGWVSAGLTVFWLVGVTNAFNLIDGSDGVAAGSAVFAALALAVMLGLGGDPWGALIAITLAGALLGFLFFNFPPASIFLGDGGSLFLGFILGALGVVASQKAPAALAVAIPVVSCGVPILDTLLAIVRRFLRCEPLFKPDRGHIHHRLRDLGLSPRRVALVIYAASALFAVLSLLLVRPERHMEAAAFVVLGVIVWIGVRRLDIPELLEIRRLLQRVVNPRRAIASNVRLREAIAALARTESPAEVLATLEYAVAGGQFVRAELWLHVRVGVPLLAPGARTVFDDEVLCWDWGRSTKGDSDAKDAPELWEVCLPLRTESGGSVGRLSLWQSVEDPDSLADLRLIATQFQAELLRALGRVGASDCRQADSPRVAAGSGAAVVDGNGMAAS